MTKQNDITGAVLAGFWIAKDHGSWFVGHGAGTDQKVLSSGHKDKQSAKKAMVKAYKEASKNRHV